MNIVFDIGGTNMRVASAEGTTLGEIRKVPTSKGPDEGIAEFVTLAKELSKGAVIHTIAGCVAGNVSNGGVISDARNLGAWQGMNIKHALSTALGAPVFVFNDAALAGVGEAHIGAGRGSRIVVYITVSTGVGGARIVEGQIDISGGVGHTSVRGTNLEDLVSGTAVKKKFGIEPKELVSIDERTILADVLAEGLVEITKKWTPDTIVLGGSMIVGVNPIPIDRVQKTLASLIPDPPNVKMAELKDNGGLIGAAILAAQNQLQG